MDHKRRFRVSNSSSYSFHSFLFCVQRMPTAPCPPFSPLSTSNVQRPTGWRCRISSYTCRPWQAPQAQPPPAVVQGQHQHDLPLVVETLVPEIPRSRDTPFPNKRIVRLWPFGQGGVGWCVEYQCVGGAGLQCTTICVACNLQRLTSANQKSSLSSCTRHSCRVLSPSGGLSFEAVAPRVRNAR